MNKRIIVYCVIVLLVLIFLITLIEYSVKNMAKKQVTSKNNQTDTSIVLERKTKKQKYEDKVVENTDEILELLKNRDYEAIYKKLDDDYKEAKYPTYSNFKDYLDKIITDDTTISLSGLFDHPNGYFATIRLSSGEEIKYTIKNAGSDYKVMFDWIYQIASTDRWVFFDDVNLNIRYYIKYIDREGYIVNITNKSNSKIHLTTYDTYEYFSRVPNSSRYNIIENTNVDVASKGKETVEFQFPVPSSTSFQPDQLQLNCTINGKDYTELINVELTDYLNY